MMNLPTFTMRDRNNTPLGAAVPYHPLLIERGDGKPGLTLALHRIGGAAGAWAMSCPLSGTSFGMVPCPPDIHPRYQSVSMARASALRVMEGRKATMGSYAFFRVWDAAIARSAIPQGWAA